MATAGTLAGDKLLLGPTRADEPLENGGMEEIADSGGINGCGAEPGEVAIP